MTGERNLLEGKSMRKRRSPAIDYSEVTAPAAIQSSVLASSAKLSEDVVQRILFWDELSEDALDVSRGKDPGILNILIRMLIMYQPLI